MAEPTILIASLLKPTADPRIRAKLANSLSKIAHLYLVGLESGSPLSSNPKITEIRLKKFDRLSLQRFWQSLKVWEQVKQIQPDVLIVNTPELLWVGLFYKIRYKGLVIYDVLENYFQNIWYQHNYPTWLKPILVTALALTEHFSLWFVDYYLLAEEVYGTDLCFVKNRNLVVANKLAGEYSAKKAVYPLQKQHFHFVYAGTISTDYGTEDALRFFIELAHFLPESTLTVIGYCSDNTYRRKLQSLAQGTEQIIWKVSAEFVPHSELLGHLLDADFALLPYRPNRSTFNCIPAKMYECLALQIPMLVSTNPLWRKLCEPENAALFIDFQDFNAQKVINQIRQTRFYPNPDPDKWLWQTEEIKLLNLIRNML